MILGGVLMIVGGMVAGLRIQNPKPAASRSRPRAATAGECARGPGTATTGQRPTREPAAAGFGLSLFL